MPAPDSTIIMAASRNRTACVPEPQMKRWMTPETIAQAEVTTKVMSKSTGTMMRNCAATGRWTSTNYGRKAAMKSRLLGLKIVITSPCISKPFGLASPALPSDASSLAPIHTLIPT